MNDIDSILLLLALVFAGIGAVIIFVVSWFVHGLIRFIRGY